jgi:hypothetical protein
MALALLLELRLSESRLIYGSGKMVFLIKFEEVVVEKNGLVKDG